MATPTGLEPATSAVTGRRANQLRYGALLMVLVLVVLVVRIPNGIRTRAAAVKGRCPRPLNDGAVKLATSLLPTHNTTGLLSSFATPIKLSGIT